MMPAPDPRPAQVANSSWLRLLLQLWLWLRLRLGACLVISQNDWNEAGAAAAAVAGPCAGHGSGFLISRQLIMHRAIMDVM